MIFKDVCSIVLSPVSIVLLKIIWKSGSLTAISITSFPASSWAHIELTSLFSFSHSFVSPHDARQWSHPMEFCNFVFVSHFSKKGWQRLAGRSPFYFTSCLTFCQEWFSVIFHFSRLRSRATRGCSLESVLLLGFYVNFKLPRLHGNVE